MDNLSQEQLDAFMLLTELQKRVVENVEAGLAPVDAYFLAGGRATNRASAAATVSALLKHANVARFRELLHGERLNHLVMTREEMRVKLTAIARCSSLDVARVVNGKVIGYTDEGEPIYEQIAQILPLDQLPPEARSAVRKIKQSRDGITVELSSDVQAMKQLAELDGLDKPKEIAIDFKNGTKISLIGMDPTTASKNYQEIMG